MSNARKTRSKRIQTLPLDLALHVARHGRTLSPIEHSVIKYLDAREEIKLHGDIARAFCGPAWDSLSFDVMMAVHDRDAKTLRELADAVESYQYETPGRDRTREVLLHLKRRTRESGRKYELKDIARFLGRKPDDDLSRLRAIAKEIKLPLAPQKVGRPKKLRRGTPKTGR